MIVIEERLSDKLPCYTSLFFRLPIYNKELFSALLQSDGSVFLKDSNSFEFPVNKLYYLVSVLIGYDDVDFIPYSEFQFGSRKAVADYKVKPYSYQLDGIEYGLNKDSWLLLDEQGLGKTLQMIYLAEELHKLGEVNHCLIICGVNSLKFNWQQEIKKFSNLTYKVLGEYTTSRGNKRVRSVQERISELKNGIEEFFVITNVETLQQTEFAQQFNKSKSNYGMIVFDEQHHCKSPTAKATKTLLKLKQKHKIALTGTVIMNKPEDQFVPLKWTGNTQQTFSQFKGMYNVYGGFGGVQVIGNKNLELLRMLLQKCSLRRLKSEVLDLPQKTYLTEYVEMGQQQREIYDQVSQGITQELDKLESPPSILQELQMNIRLRQITAYPGILSSDVQQSAKLDRLCELQDSIVQQGDKIVVFCTFKQCCTRAQEMLSKYGCVICTGDSSDEEIQYNKEQFENNRDIRVMVATWQKMGTGHTLTQANYAIFVDTPWTDQDFKQSSDRIYRIGQNKKVFIIKLITVDSYDERVEEILQQKKCLSGYLVDNGNISECKNIFE